MEHPQDEVPRNEVASFDVPLSEEAGNEGVHSEDSQNEFAHEENAHLEAPFSEASEIVEARYEIASEGTDHDQGYFKLAHSAFSDPKLRKLSGDSFRLFVWMSSRAWRYVNSQGYIRASVRYISEKTGMSHATVSRGLKTLRETNLVRLCRTDFHDGNLWKVSPKVVGNRGPDSTNPVAPPRKKAAHSEGARKEQAIHSKSESTAVNLSEQPPQNVGNIRSIKNSRNSTLSPELPEKLREYFSELKPQRKREGEWQAFRELLQDYSKQDIADCVDYLMRFGVPGSGEACHSPMLYLAEAIPQVLGLVTHAHQRNEMRRQQADEVRKKAEQEAAEERLFQQAREHFVGHFPTESEQAKFVEDYMAKHFGGIRPPKNVAQNIAIMDWFQHLPNYASVVKIG